MIQPKYYNRFRKERIVHETFAGYDSKPIMLTDEGSNLLLSESVVVF